MAKKPVLLCIMDGFGWVPGETYGNAVVAAKTPHLDALMEKYPMTTIEASGMAVGLPDGQMGNSEVGHTNMGAGRIVYQQLTLITKSIKDGEMLKNPVLVKNMQAAIDAGKAIHLMGLVGTGGVHSHADHWFGVLEMAKHLGAKNVYLHCITDVYSVLAVRVMFSVTMPPKFSTLGAGGGVVPFSSSLQAVNTAIEAHRAIAHVETFMKFVFIFLSF